MGSVAQGDDAMNKKETIQFLAAIKLAYPSSFKDIDKDTKLATVNMWQSNFKHTPYQIMSMALDKHIKTSPFEPKIADIMGCLKSLHYEAMEGALLAESQIQMEAFVAVMDYTKPYTSGEMSRGVSNNLMPADVPLQIGDGGE